MKEGQTLTSFSSLTCTKSQNETLPQSSHRFLIGLQKEVAKMVSTMLHSRMHWWDGIANDICVETKLRLRYWITRRVPKSHIGHSYLQNSTFKLKSYQFDLVRKS